MINFLVILSLLCFSWEPNFVHATYKYATFMVWADMSGCKKLLEGLWFPNKFSPFWDSGFSCKYVLCCRWANCAALAVSVSRTNRVIKFGRSGCWLNTVRCLRWPAVVASGHQVGSWPPTATSSVANLGHLIGLPPPWASKSTYMPDRLSDWRWDWHHTLCKQTFMTHLLAASSLVHVGPE